MNANARLARNAALVVPYAYAALLPLLPLLVELADVLPRGIAVVGAGFAMWLAVAVAIAVAIGIAAAFAGWGAREFVRAPVFAALVLLVASECLAAAAGVSWRSGLFEVLCQVGVGAACVIFWLTLGQSAARRTFLALFLSSGIAACAFAIALTLSRHPPAAFAYEHGRAAGTFLQPNEFAGYLLFIIPLGVAQWDAPPALRRLGFAAAAIGALALAMSASRAAVLGLLLAMPILVRRFGPKALAGYAIAAAVALALGLTVMRDVAHDPSENASRIAVWRGAARMAERFAPTGVGPVAFSLAYPLFKMPDAQVDEVHAHDLPLNVLIENGILGFAAFAYAVFACVRASRDGGKGIPPGDRERGLLFAGISTGFAASAVQNGVDLVTTFVLLMWWPMVGLLLGTCSEAPEN